MMTVSILFLQPMNLFLEGTQIGRFTADQGVVMPPATAFSQSLFVRCLQEGTEKATTGHLLITCCGPQTRVKRGLSALTLPHRHRIPLIINPVAPASYPPHVPQARMVPSPKSRGSEQRDWNASEDICKRLCATTSVGYAWEQLESKKPVENGAGETIWFEPSRVIHLLLSQPKCNTNKRSSEAR